MSKSVYTKEQQKMIDHNESIIENYLLHAYKNGVTDKEIDDYYRKATKQQKEFRKYLRRVGGSVEFEKATQMYVIPKEKDA